MSTPLGEIDATAVATLVSQGKNAESLQVHSTDQGKIHFAAMSISCSKTFSFQGDIMDISLAQVEVRNNMV